MTDLRETFKDAWSHALVGLNAAEHEAEKMFDKIADAAGLTPDEVKRHARDFGERLQGQRKEIEKTIDDAVKRALERFRFPSRAELDGLRRRVDDLTAKIDALTSERAPAPTAVEPAAPSEEPSTAGDSADGATEGGAEE